MTSAYYSVFLTSFLPLSLPTSLPPFFLVSLSSYKMPEWNVGAEGTQPLVKEQNTLGGRKESLGAPPFTNYDIWLVPSAPAKNKLMKKTVPLHRFS